VPFSQNTTVIEKTGDNLKTQFSFSADLTRLPYRAKLSAEGIVTLVKSGTRGANISIDGKVFYSRGASAEMGADENEYRLTVRGRRVAEDLPPFVATALGKAGGGGGAGHIPGPGGATQAAAGILFPPLVGLVVNVIQENIRARAAAKAAAKRRSRMRDREWYKRKYPKASDETIATLMLADAMGNTDEPDEGDAVSMGDNEQGSGGSATGAPRGSDEYGSDEEWEYESESESDHEPEQDLPSDEQAENSQIPAEPEQSEQPEQPNQPQEPEEPTTMVVKTSHRGGETLLIKDNKTGQWINAETGNPFDLEQHQQNSEADFRRHMDAAEKERWLAENRQTTQDLINDEKMKNIKHQYEQEKYRQRLEQKYGTSDMGKITDIINERRAKDMAAFNKWQKIGNRYEKLEIGAKVAGVLADVTIDGLAGVTPYGSAIRAGYKGLKGIAGTAADRSANMGTGDRWTTRTIAGTFAEGFIKGTADAGLDFVQNPYLKAVAAVAGESTGTAAGAAIRGGTEDWRLAAKQGFVDGAGKATMGAIGDKLTENMASVALPKDAPAKFFQTTKNVLRNKGSLTKVALGLTDEFAVKPVVINSVKDAVQRAHEAGLPGKK